MANFLEEITQEKIDFLEEAKDANLDPYIKSLTVAVLDELKRAAESGKFSHTTGWCDIMGDGTCILEIVNERKRVQFFCDEKEYSDAVFVQNTTKQTVPPMKFKDLKLENIPELVKKANEFLENQEETDFATI